MEYLHRKRNETNRKIKYITKHPFFGFLVIGLVLIFLVVIHQFGVRIPITSIGTLLVYIIVGLGFSLLLGYSGLASLGTAGFIGLGTYILGYFTKELEFPFIVVLIISLIIAVIIGAIVGFISLRIEGMYLAIITLGLSEILIRVFNNADKFTGGPNGLVMRNFYLLGIKFNEDMTFVFLIISLVLVLIATYNIMKSPTGRAMTAMKNSQSAAQAMGISVFKYRLIAFIMSTVYAVLGGVLLMSFNKITTPTNWNLAISLNILAAVIVGGPRSIWGIILGTFLIFGVDLVILQRIAFFRNNPNFTVVFNGILIILVVMFYPGGLSRLIQTTKYKLDRAFQKLKVKRKEQRYGTDD